MYNLTILDRWHEFGRPPADLAALCEDWDESVFDAHLVSFFPNGPTNIHQITLADALLWTWTQYPEHRRLTAANVVCFTKGTRP